VTDFLVTGGILPHFLAKSFTPKFKRRRGAGHSRGHSRVSRLLMCALYLAPCRPLPRPKKAQ